MGTNVKACYLGLWKHFYHHIQIFEAKNGDSENVNNYKSETKTIKAFCSRQ